MTYIFESQYIDVLAQKHTVDIINTNRHIQMNHKLHQIIHTVKMPSKIQIRGCNFYECVITRNKHKEEIIKTFEQFVTCLTNVVNALSNSKKKIINIDWVTRAFKTLNTTDIHILNCEMRVQIHLLLKNNPSLDNDLTRKYLAVLYEDINHANFPLNSCLYANLIRHHQNALMQITSLEVLQCWDRVLRLYIHTHFNYDKCVKLGK